MFVSRVIKYKIVFFYLFAFLISWTFWLGMFFFYGGNATTNSADYFTLLIPSTLGALGPLLSLAILEKLTKKEIEVNQIIATAKIRHANKLWFIPAIFAFPIIAVLGNFLYFLLGWEGQLRLITTGPDTLGIFVLPVMAVHFAASLITSPLFEEPGWRSFALRNLQSSYGREVGSLIVGTLWWLWHQPMNLTFSMQPTIYGFLSMIAFSFMIDSLFNLSGKNLFTAMLAHQSYGTLFIFIYIGQENTLTLAMLIGFVCLLRIKEWKTSRKLEDSKLAFDPAQVLIARLLTVLIKETVSQFSIPCTCHQGKKRAAYQRTLTIVGK